MIKRACVRNPVDPRHNAMQGVDPGFGAREMEGGYVRTDYEMRWIRRAGGRARDALGCFVAQKFPMRGKARLRGEGRLV
jgi:hypothetical protein